MQYSNYDMKNNVHATLSTAISSVATTIQLTAWQGARFWNTFPQIATLESFDENWKVVKREIVQITWRSGDNLTVVRAFAPCPENDDANSQSQNAISFNADDTISLYIPKEIFDIIKKSLNDIYDNGANNMRTEVVSWLQVEVNPWQVLVWSAYYDFAGWAITLTDNATNYLEVDEDGNLANNTTGRNDENTKLAIITTASGSVTNIKDRRLWTVWWKIGGVNIHDLTEKISLSPDDEFIIADSEAIFQNKKIKAWNVLWIWEWFAIENISKWDFILSENIINSSDWYVGVWYTEAEKISIKRIWNWTTFDSIYVVVSKYWSPTTLNVRIESDSGWDPSWNLIDANAYWTISGSDLTTSPTSVVVSLAWNVTIPNWTICHLVFAIDTASSTNNFQIYWYNATPKLFKIKQYNWSIWNDFSDYWPYFNVLDYTLEWQLSMGGNMVQFCFSDDGNHMCAAQYGNLLRSWDLNTPFDISAWVTNAKTYTLWSSSYPCAWVGRDKTWTKCIGARGGWNIYTATLSTARDISTWTADSTSTLQTLWFTDNNVTVFVVSPDGIHLYKCYWTTIAQVDLWTARTFSGTNTYVWSKSIDSDVWWWSMTTFALSPDWKWLYAYGWWWNRKLVCFKLSTPRDITTATYNSMSANALWNVAWSGLWFMSNKNLLFHFASQYFRQYSSISPQWSNILCNITADWLHNTETWKADNSMDFVWWYVPCASVLDYVPWQKVKYNISYNNNKTGLVPWTKYYLWSNWWTTDVANNYEVWIAIEPTILKLKQTY